MRNPTLLLLSIALSAQLTSAVPVPTEKPAQIDQVGNVVKSAASTLQQTTARLSTGMAGGMAGMSGVTGIAGVAGPGGSLGKRQKPPSLNLGVAGLKPEDVFNDPTTALRKFPIPLKKRLLGGGLGGILGALKGLTPQETDKAPPPALPVPNPTKVKDEGTDSKVNIDDPQSTNSEEFPDLDATLEGTSAARNGSTPTNSNVNEATNSNEEETPAAEPLTSRATPENKGDFLGNLTPKEKVGFNDLEKASDPEKEHGDGYSDPQKVLEDLGANMLVKSVIDAPDLTGINKRIDPLGKLNGLGTTVASVSNLMKALPVPVPQAG